MLTDIQVRTGLGRLLSLSLDDIEEGYSVQEITGLDPVPATINSSGYATQDGEQYNSSKRGKRNIVLKLGLEPDYIGVTARKLRDRLYGFLMPKSEVTLRFISDEEPTVEIVGRVESFDAPLFTAEPMATISVLCMLPDFIDKTPITFSGNSTADQTETILDYDGTVETGFVFRMRIDRALSQFSLKSRATDNVQRSMDFAATLQAGDVIEVSTVPGSKGVYLIRTDNRSSLLYALSPYSPWIELFPGPNYVRLSATGAALAYTIAYTNKYGGL